MKRLPLSHYVPARCTRCGEITECTLWADYDGEDEELVCGRCAAATATRPEAPCTEDE